VDILLAHMFTVFGQPGYLAAADLDANGLINARDSSLQTTNMFSTSVQKYPGFAGCVPLE